MELMEYTLLTSKGVRKICVLEHNKGSFRTRWRRSLTPIFNEDTIVWSVDWKKSGQTKPLDWKSV